MVACVTGVPAGSTGTRAHTSSKIWIESVTETAALALGSIEPTVTLTRAFPKAKFTGARGSSGVCACWMSCV